MVPIPAPQADAELHRLLQQSQNSQLSAPWNSWSIAQSLLSSLPSVHSLYPSATLRLAEALHWRGEFADAISYAHAAAEVYLTQAEPQTAADCYRLIAEAYTELRQTAQAQSALDSARHLYAPDSSPALAHCNRLEARIFHYAGKRAEALARAEAAATVLQKAADPTGRGLAYLEFGRLRFGADPSAALDAIEKAELLFAAQNQTVLLTHCRHFRALALQEMNEYSQALALHQENRRYYSQEEMGHFVAWTDNMLCVNLWRLDRHSEALECGERALAFYTQRGIGLWQAMCYNNLAIVHYGQGNYEKAREFYASAAAISEAEDLPVDAARCHQNLALVLERLGRYDQALPLYQRAQDAFERHGFPQIAVQCERNLASLYRKLGRHDEALAIYRRVRAHFGEQRMAVDVAWTDVELAHLYREMEQPFWGIAPLELAHALFQQRAMPLQTALCQRELGRLYGYRGERERSIGLLTEAESIFRQHESLVEAALCNIALGELYVEGEENIARLAAVEGYFRAAEKVVTPALPEEAWRVHWGLGRCALQRGDGDAALVEWLKAIRYIGWMRAYLPTEQLSSHFFADHSLLYAEALSLALDLDAYEDALAIVESGKTQTFVSWLDRPTNIYTGPDDDFLCRLQEMEAAQRQEINDLRTRLRVSPEDVSPPTAEAEILERLAALSTTYEETVERLRSLLPLEMDGRGAAFFSLVALRQAAQKLPRRWGCLSYSWEGDRLLIFYINAEKISLHTKQLNGYDLRMLEQATSTDAYYREVVYRNTINGEDIGPQDHLNHLYRLLIPPEVAELVPEDSLFISPHQRLHQLPFQTLQARGRFLVEQVTLVNLPSLSALTTHFALPPSPDALVPGLACALADFGEQQRPLPGTVREVAAMQGLLGDELQILRQGAAQRRRVLELNESGELARFHLLHFATHVILDADAPSQSRILLADDGLTLYDILTLDLRTRLVMLSTCNSGVGKHFSGNELMSLAWAFLQAGTRTVVASLWPVEDEATATFVERFYTHLSNGRDQTPPMRVQQALRLAQLDLLREGHPPYDWGSFIVTGMD